LEFFRKPIKGILKKIAHSPQWRNFENVIIAIPDRDRNNLKLMNFLIVFKKPVSVLKIG
jgi:hypothetical protein